MLKTSEDQLTNEILSAIMVRTSIVLAQLLGIDFDFFKGNKFHWFKNDVGFHTLTTTFNGEDIILYWNGLPNEKCSMTSNIERTTLTDLPWFVQFEAYIFTELEEIKKDIPAQPFTDDNDEEYSDDNI